jgi:acyl carrier protein
MTSVAERVIAIAEELSGKDVDVSSRLLEDLELDSLDRIQFAIDLEEEFGIDIPDADVDRPELGTVDGLIRYIEGRTVGAAA